MASITENDAQPTSKTLAPVVITGTTSGIGAALAVQLANEGRELVLVNRSLARTQATLGKIRSKNPDASIHLVEADMSEPESIRRGAEEIARLAPQVSVLFNNAGVLIGELVYAKSGHEMHYQVNTIAPYLLARLLTPQLAAAAAESKGPGPDGQAVVVSTNSAGVDRTGDLRVSDLRKPAKFAKLIGPYAQSKLALLTINQVIAKEFEQSGILVRDAAPGPTKTVMTAGTGMPRWLVYIRNLLFNPPEAGAERVYDAAFHPSLQSKTAIFTGKSARLRQLPKSATNQVVQDEVMKLVVEDAGI